MSCELEIDLEDVYRGRTVEIDVPRAETCRTCNGNGAKPSTSVKECPECRGAGHVGLLEASSSEDLFQVTFCSRCGGRGTIVRKPCKECNGSGMVNKTRRTRIEVPPGVEDGGTLVVRGEGESAYENGLPGDLYIAINVRPHEVFRRVDADIIAEVPIDLTDMVFGGEVNVPTMDGYVKLKIPKGTKSGAVFRLKSKGLPIINSGSRGDELVKVRIRTSPWSILYQLIAHVTSMWNKLVGPWKILIDREQGRACLAS